MESYYIKEDTIMEFTVILIIFALGLLVVAGAFFSGVQFVFKGVKRIFKSLFGDKDK